MELVPGVRRDDVWTPAFARVTVLRNYYDSINKLFISLIQFIDKILQSSAVLVEGGHLILFE